METCCKWRHSSMQQTAAKCTVRRQACTRIRTRRCCHYWQQLVRFADREDWSRRRGLPPVGTRVGRRPHHRGDIEAVVARQPPAVCRAAAVRRARGCRARRRPSMGRTCELQCRDGRCRRNAHACRHLKPPRARIAPMPMPLTVPLWAPSADLDLSEISGFVIWAGVGRIPAGLRQHTRSFPRV